MTRTHVLATLLVAGCALAATATPAVAQQTIVKDARGDVWGATDPNVPTPSPTIREGDITRAVVRFARDHASVRVVFAALSRNGPYAQYSVKLQGKQGKLVREVLVETSKRDRSGSHRVFKGNGGQVDGCDATHDVDYRNDRVTVTVDRSCLSRPRSIRANVNTARATGSAVFYSDNVHDTAAESDVWSRWVRRSR